MKKCNCCNHIKDDSEFKPKKLQSGNMSLSSQCKQCLSKKASDKYRSMNDRDRENRDKLCKLWRSNNRDKINALKRKYNLINKTIKLSNTKHEEHVKVYNKYLDKLNRIMTKKCDQHVKEWKSNLKVYAAWKQNHDMSYVVYQRLKRGIRRCIKNYSGKTNWLSILGYSSNDLKLNIESKFVDGMSWDNRHEWHIDHIFPLCAVDVESHHDINFIKLFRLDNLRPIWSHHNRIKYHSHDKYLRKNLAGPT